MTIMINDFEKYEKINEGFFDSIKKLFSFIKKDNEITNAISYAIEDAGQEAVHLFLYDLSKYSDLKEYHNKKDKIRGNIGKAKRSQERSQIAKEKKQASNKLRDAKLAEAKKYEDVKKKLQSIVGNIYNVKILDRGLERSHLYKLHDILTNQTSKKRTRAELDIIENFSKSIALDEFDETKTKEYLEKIKIDIGKKKLKW